MKQFVLVLSLFVAAIATPQNYINGGTTVRRDEKPFVVSVQFRVAPNYMHVCGGVTISPTWIMTAGSCLNRDMAIEVVSGKYDLMVFEDEQQRRGIFVRSSVVSTDGRIALLHLATPLNYDTHTQEATLAGPLNPGNPEEEVMLVGWPFLPGLDPTPGAQTLRKATFKIMSRESCFNVTNGRVTHENEFCTNNANEGDVGRVSSCDGNIGSPVYIDKPDSDYIIGILLRTPPNCDSSLGYTGVYARVANYRRWISGVIDQ